MRYCLFGRELLSGVGVRSVKMICRGAMLVEPERNFDSRRPRIALQETETDSMIEGHCGGPQGRRRGGQG